MPFEIAEALSERTVGWPSPFCLQPVVAGQASGSKLNALTLW